MSFPESPSPLVHSGATRPSDQSHVLTQIEKPGIKEGARSLFEGFGFILRSPNVWPLALVPVAIAITLLTILSWLVVETVPVRVDALMGPSSSAVYGVFSSLVKAVVTLVALLFSALLSFSLAQPLSGPALERIVRRAEAEVGAPTWPQTSFLSDVVRSFESILVGFAFGLPILALIFVIDLVFPPAIVVTFPLKIAVTAVLITWDLCDYPLSIRGVHVHARVAFLRRNIRAVIGFGLALALLSLIPCAILLVLPSGVAGAARLIVALERWEASRR